MPKDTSLPQISHLAICLHLLKVLISYRNVCIVAESEQKCKNYFYKKGQFFYFVIVFFTCLLYNSIIRGYVLMKVPRKMRF